MGGQPCAGAHALGVRMLLVFAPQVVFYGLAVVLGGVLSADERFAWPAVSPLLSSLVVVVGLPDSTATLAGPGVLPERLGRGAELVLSVGTTRGRGRARARPGAGGTADGTALAPTVRFPVGVAATVRVAALAGAATLAAQQLSSAVTIRLANSGTAVGTVVIVAVAQTVFLLPWAVLSLPVATTAFPRLAAAWDRGDTDRVPTAVRAGHCGWCWPRPPPEPCCSWPWPNRPASCCSAATPVRCARSRRRWSAWSIGLIGWSLVALLARTLYAAGRVRAAAAAQVAGQLASSPPIWCSARSSARCTAGSSSAWATPSG